MVTMNKYMYNHNVNILFIVTILIKEIHLN